MRGPQCTRWGAAGALAAALLGAAEAVPAQPSPVAETATYQGADRAQRLIEGAKREKDLTLYSVIPPEDMSALAAAFDKKYGVKVKVWRADSESVLQRVLTEARAAHFEVDLVVASSSALEPLHRDNLLQEVKSPYTADLLAEALPLHRQWSAVYLSTFVQAFNTRLVPKQRLPKTWQDLLRPEWRGMLGIEAEDYDWFAQLMMELGEAQGLKLFREIVAGNGVSVRKGHSQLTSLVAAGEVPLALDDYGFLAEQARRRGTPLDWMVLPPAIARPTAEGLAKNAPHPNAAVLFHDFLISEAQPILASRHFVPASSRIASPLAGGPLKLIDAALMFEQSRKWQELYQRVILGPSR